jgi:ADP-ribose pyrophosphatase
VRPEPAHHHPFPILVGSQEIYDGRVVKLRVDTLEVASGSNVRREVVEHPGAVVIVPEDAQGRILFVRQYRYAVGRDLLELPAGTLEHNEAPEVCARRELEEETGHSAGDLQALGSFYTAPGFCTEHMHVFAARALTEASAAHDDDEDISVEPLSLEEALGRIDGGEIVDAKSIAALHLYIRKRP